MSLAQAHIKIRIDRLGRTFGDGAAQVQALQDFSLRPIAKAGCWSKTPLADLLETNIAKGPSLRSG